MGYGVQLLLESGNAKPSRIMENRFGSGTNFSGKVEIYRSFSEI
jgi:hypothetical protein